MSPDASNCCGAPSGVSEPGSISEKGESYGYVRRARQKQKHNNRRSSGGGNPRDHLSLHSGPFVRNSLRRQHSPEPLKRPPQLAASPSASSPFLRDRLEQPFENVARTFARSCVSSARSCALSMHGGASGSGGPPGKRNGQYRHGERTKTAIAEQQKFSALLKMLRAGLT